MSVSTLSKSAAGNRFADSLRVGGLVPLTTNDFPGRLAAVIFCQGCPWQCRYCHNSHLIPPAREGMIPWGSVMEFLDRRSGLLDGAVFSGGEPTMQPALYAAVREVRELGFEAGLHTAGQYPRMLEQVLPELSWVGMDIKAPPGEYESVTGRREDFSAQRRCIRMLIDSGIEVEFRTTYHSALLNHEDLLRIAELLAESGAKRYVVQIFRSAGCIDAELNRSGPVPGMPAALSETLCKMFESFEVRGP